MSRYESPSSIMNNRWDQARLEKYQGRRRDISVTKDVLVSPKLTEGRLSYGRASSVSDVVLPPTPTAQRKVSREVAGNIVTEVEKITITGLPPTKTSPSPREPRRQASDTSFDRRSKSREDRLELKVGADLDSPIPGKSATLYEEDFTGYRDIRVRKETIIRRDADLASRRSRNSIANSVTSGSSSSSSPSSSSSSKASVASSQSSRPSSTTSSSSPSVRHTKRGRTEIPKRIATRSVLEALNYEFESDGDYYVINQALKEEEINNVMTLSKANRNAEEYSGATERRKTELIGGSLLSLDQPLPDDVIETRRTQWINPPSYVFDGAPPVPTSSRRISRQTMVEEKELDNVSASEYSELIQPTPPRRPTPPTAPTVRGRPKLSLMLGDGIERGMPRASSQPYREKDVSASYDVMFDEIRRKYYGPNAKPDSQSTFYFRTTDADDRVKHTSPARDELPVRVVSAKRQDMVEYRPASVMTCSSVSSCRRESDPGRNVVRADRDKRGRMFLVRSAH